MSEEQARQVYREAEDFSAQLARDGWIDETPFGRTEIDSPGDLFSSGGSDRPLVVGLFGGTGVGKSSLLNRLAGDSIARTGVVRPTSMEITAARHHDAGTSLKVVGGKIQHWRRYHANIYHVTASTLDTACQCTD